MIKECDESRNNLQIKKIMDNIPDFVCNLHIQLTYVRDSLYELENRVRESSNADDPIAKKTIEYALLLENLVQLLDKFSPLKAPEISQ